MSLFRKGPSKLKYKSKFKKTLRIPEGAVGTYSVQSHPAVAVTRLNSKNGRNSPCDPSTWSQSLLRGTQVLYTESPTMRLELDGMLKNTFNYGTVLVSGLGLGYVPTLLSQRERIIEILVVEPQPEILRLVRNSVLEFNKQSGEKVRFVQQHLITFLRTKQSQVEKWTPADKRRYAFDWAFYDCRQCKFEDVVHLQNLSAEIVKRRPLCWGEERMRNKLFMMLCEVWDSRSTVQAHPKDGSSVETTPPAWVTPFLSLTDAINLQKDEFKAHATIYAQVYGTVNWQRTWDLYYQALTGTRGSVFNSDVTALENIQSKIA